MGSILAGVPAKIAQGARCVWEIRSRLGAESQSPKRGFTVGAATSWWFARVNDASLASTSRKYEYFHAFVYFHAGRTSLLGVYGGGILRYMVRRDGFGVPPRTRRRSGTGRFRLRRRPTDCDPSLSTTANLPEEAHDCPSQVALEGKRESWTLTV